MARKYLLSIDGGGIRGIIPASALVKLERTTGRPARETFAFVAGTSTGAIIAAALAAGVPATRILDLYLNRAREIFTQNIFNIVRRGVFGAMYSTQKLHDVLADELGAARDWRINDAPIDVLITAKRVSDGMPWYFVRDNPANAGRTGRLRLADCITASSAAPTYFQPWTMPEDPLPPGWQPIGALVDGGAGVAGNPVYQTCVEAFYYTNQYEVGETTIISLGTGRFTLARQPTWIGAWLEWVLAELLRSPGEQQTELVQRHFSQAIFYRLDPDFKALDPTLERDIPLDDVGSIERLREYGERFAALIDWNAILSGADTTFRISKQKTLWQQYKRP
jgi:patatin-like phospholipase/acyl hydrolase